MLIGAVLFIWGIKKNKAIKDRSETYEKTEGYFIDKELYSEAKRVGRRRKSATYSLIYIYQVDGIDYTVKTDYGTSVIPQYGSAQEILYNPMNPSEAIVGGTNSSTALIVIGLMFLLIPLVFLMVILYGDGVFDGWRFNVMDFVVGIVMFVLGATFYYMLGDGMSIRKLVWRAGLFSMIPVMFIAVGILLMCRAFKGEKEVDRR